jgi:hypothetical protein
VILGVFGVTSNVLMSIVRSAAVYKNAYGRQEIGLSAAFNKTGRISITCYNF